MLHEAAARPAGGQLTILRQASGRPGAQGEAGERERNADGHGERGGAREPGEDSHEQEPTGDAKPRDGVGIGFREGDHSARLSRGRRCAPMMARSTSNTSSGAMFRMLESMAVPRL